MEKGKGKGKKKGIEEALLVLGEGLSSKAKKSDSESDSEKEDEDTVSNDIAALETDADYIAWVRNVWQPLMQKEYGQHICQERAFLQWRDQDGFCSATGHVLVGVAAGKGLYSPAVITVNPNFPTSDSGNCRIVAHFVAKMYDALKGYNLAWPQFVRLVAFIDKDAE